MAELVNAVGLEPTGAQAPYEFESRPSDFTPEMAQIVEKVVPSILPSPENEMVLTQ